MTRRDHPLFELAVPFVPPLDLRSMLAFLGPRAVAGVESVEGLRYARSVRAGERVGVISVRPDPQWGALLVEGDAALRGARASITRKVEHLFDVDGDAARISEHLGRDERLAAQVARRPGLRLPGCFDPFELAVRAVLGQQVSVASARTLAGRVAARFGEAIERPRLGVSRVFPTPETISAANESDLVALGVLASRSRTVIALAELFAAEPGLVKPGAPVDVAVARLRAIRGIGEWTAQYISMRAMHATDAFLADDLGVRKALGGAAPKAIRAMAEPWRPYRAYAVMHLWHGLGEGEARRRPD